MADSESLLSESVSIKLVITYESIFECKKADMWVWKGGGGERRWVGLELSNQ